SATLTEANVSAGTALGSVRLSLTTPLASAWRRQANSWLALMPRCRATCDTEQPGRHASSTSWSFSSSLHRRRRSGPVMISTRPLIAFAPSRTTRRMTRRCGVRTQGGPRRRNTQFLDVHWQERRAPWSEDVGTSHAITDVGQQRILH